LEEGLTPVSSIDIWNSISQRVFQDLSISYAPIDPKSHCAAAQKNDYCALGLATMNGGCPLV
jgi:hypothetical protein